MSAPHRSARLVCGCCALALLAGVTAAAPVPPTAAREPAAASLRPGMTAGQVRKRLGPPERVARQILFRRHLEQWVYPAERLRVEFECVPGAEAQILTVRSAEGKTLPPFPKP